MIALKYAYIHLHKDYYKSSSVPQAHSRTDSVVGMSEPEGTQEAACLGHDLLGGLAAAGTVASVCTDASLPNSTQSVQSSSKRQITHTIT